MDSWTQYLEKLHNLVDSQTKQMKELEKRVSELERKAEETKQTPSTNIEKIEYNFDQLKIETLEGTLNIGLTPQNGKEFGIEDFAVEEKPFPPKLSGGQAVKDQILSDLQNYLSGQGPADLQQIAGQYGRHYDETYQQFILQDVQKQLDHRVGEYLQQANTKNGVTDQAQIDAIVNQIKQEIHESLHHFVQGQAHKGDE
ncbi:MULTISPECIES: spore germination protein GerPC [Pontibacillus]|uniref:Spore germination protein GerPC n=1 Tax=Pontibacillus chungwhensis TaxID=265426 RepID=A0ABY8V3U5_9BACI|nr:MULTISPECIES: spore germination protein GerPC [Pontibacillus]MCD5325011.1 spore germination protein GerPC [Pontibacillus sp. HN14]WIG00134.1 spore germination protein GerPC [Pontibacillus chungwhensis]